ncbi:Hypothetical protein FKW44_012742, partial [Caligus rogercresseyi]
MSMVCSGIDILTAPCLVMGTAEDLRNVCGTSVGVKEAADWFVERANGELLDKEEIEVK